MRSSAPIGVRLHRGGRVPGCTARGGCRAPGRKDIHRCRESAGLLTRDAANPVTGGQRHSGRADPTRVPRHPGRQSAQHCQLLGMVDPARMPGEHDIFICGDNDSAKTQVREGLQSFGWPPSAIIDLDDIGLRTRQRRPRPAVAGTVERCWKRRFQHQGRPIARTSDLHGARVTRSPLAHGRGGVGATRGLRSGGQTPRLVTLGQ